MNRRSWLLAISASLVVLIATLFVEFRETAASSTLSLGARGWLAARLYLERRDVEVTLLDRPLHQNRASGALVLALPWQRRASGDELDTIRRRLFAGGTIIFAYTGDEDAPGEPAIAERLGLDWEVLREEPPMSPLAWRRYVSEEWELSAAGDAPPLRIGAFARAPHAPEGSEIWYRAPEGEPVVFVVSSGAGRIVVLPSETFSNARVLSGGNADLLETLSAFLGEAWLFDEYHHGLATPLSPEQRRPRVALDLLLAHLALLYVLIVWRMAKRFGPVRQEQALLRGSTRSFLLGLGALHDRLRHYRKAGPLLVSRAQAFQPHLDFGTRIDDIETGPDLVGLAIDVAQRQSVGRSSR